MTRNQDKRGGVTAEQLMDQLDADPEFQRRATARDAELAEMDTAWKAAEKPIVADLWAAGVQVDSPWDLVNTSDPYPDALPVLMAHLERGDYPDRVLEGLARALAVKPAAPYWPAFARLYRTAGGPDVREGLAVALAASATKANFDELVELLSDTSLDDTRIHLVRPVARLGGERGMHVLDRLRSDPVLTRQIGLVLDRSKRD